MGFPYGSVINNPPTMEERQETQVQPMGSEDTLEEGMATYSITLTWRIPWMEEPDRLQFIGSQTFGHTEAT